MKIIIKKKRFTPKTDYFYFELNQNILIKPMTKFKLIPLKV
jgi:hypothetical protein